MDDHTTPTGPARAADSHDAVDAIVIGGGHNGLVTAAYLAKAGMRVTVLEARPIVGGTAGSETFAGARVNLCSCDHVTFRTTGVIDELALESRGLRYLDVTPSGVNRDWESGSSWTHWHDLEETLAGLAATHPSQVDGYRRYAKAALPAARLILEVGAQPPTLRDLTRLGIRRRFAGLPTVMRWSRRSAADVLRGFFDHDALIGPALVSGPMVWGVSPELPGTGLGALVYAMRHVARVGRPVGGSGSLTEALRRAVEAYGGVVETGAKVTAIRCGTAGVRGVRLADGRELDAPIVVSAADPQRTFVEWLERPPAAAHGLIERWRAKPVEDGYESKIDAVVSEVPVIRGHDQPLSSTLTLAPSIAEMDQAAQWLASGRVIDRPGMFVNVPSLLDPTLLAAGRPAGHHVLSIEVLLTPFAHPGGWARSAEPQRWLELVDGICDNDLRGSIVDMRVMSPDVYEQQFHLPRGHATSFAGGPLAALRNPDPELTRYETAVAGLYLTGAATFPGAGIWGASGRNCATVVLGRS